MLCLLCRGNKEVCMCVYWDWGYAVLMNITAVDAVTIAVQCLSMHR